jgi:hypothetical protein
MFLRAPFEVALNSATSTTEKNSTVFLASSRRYSIRFALAKNTLAAARINSRRVAQM